MIRQGQLKGLLWLWCVVVLLGCGQRPSSAPIGVSVTIEPQRFFVDRISGGHVRASVVVPAGQSPEAYDPTPGQMAEIVSSRAYLRIGKIGFEVTWMDKIQMLNGSLAVYDLSEGIKWEEEDPHIWNSFEGARVIASNTLKACIELDPDRASQYEENYEGLLRDIRVREERVRKLLSPLSGHAFIIYHPTLTYFAREFDLVQLAIEEHGKEPTPGDMYRLIDRAKVLHARTAFIQQEFDIKNLHTVARESGATIALLHPLTYRPLDELVRIACLLAP